MVELQPLALVYRHQAHAVTLLTMVGVGIHGDILQVDRQTDFILVAAALIVAYGVEQFLHILQPLCLGVLAQHPRQSRLFEHLVKQFRNTGGEHRGASLLYKRDEFLQRFISPRPLPFLDMQLQGLIARDVLAARIIAYFPERSVAEPPGRCIDD